MFWILFFFLMLVTIIVSVAEFEQVERGSVETGDLAISWRPVAMMTLMVLLVVSRAYLDYLYWDYLWTTTSL